MANTPIKTEEKSVTRAKSLVSEAASHDVSAILESHNQPERKVRLVANLVRGKKVSAALSILSFLPKRAAAPMKKLIESAVANAKQQGDDPDTLQIKSVVVENAGMLKRYMPRAFGRASLIRHRKSRIIVTLTSATLKLTQG